MLSITKSIPWPLVRRTSDLFHDKLNLAAMVLSEEESSASLHGLEEPHTPT